MIARLGYPMDDQHYFAGFVLNGADRALWAPIAEAAEAARRAGVGRTFVWALPQVARDGFTAFDGEDEEADVQARSEEHTSELQSLMRISYAVFCLKKKKTIKTHDTQNTLRQKLNNTRDITQK